MMNNKLKRTLLLLFVFIGGFHLYAQFKQPMISLEHFDEKRFQWGYYFGANTFDFKIDYRKLNYNNPQLQGIQNERKMGFNVGLTGQARLIRYIDLRIGPGLVYNRRVLTFPNFTENRDAVREVPSTYIYMPLLLKFSADRWYSIKPYVTAGASMVFDLSGNTNLTVDSSSRTFRSTKNVFFCEFGFRFDFYTHYFRVSPSVRALFSINNKLVPDYDPNSRWTGSLNGLKTRGFLFCLNFE